MTRTAKRIAVVSGSRAEAGLLMSTIEAIWAHPRLTLQLIVAGSHLVQNTWRDFIEAGIPINARVRMQMANRSGRLADSEALGRGVTGFGRVLNRLQPDVMLILGDRIEPLSAACAATTLGIRIAHIHGGDRAEGLADEAIRHAISKLAHLHLPATATSKRRLIRMGELQDRVYCVGSPAVDGLSLIEPAHDSPTLIVIQHPAGGQDEDEARCMLAILAATRSYDRLVLSPNLDAGHEGIRRAIREAKIKAVEHLPRQRFLSLLKGARAIVGNSSAGLIEAAVLRVPCVNVGPRQNGREKPANVIDCVPQERAIRRAIRQALSLDLTRMRHPYGRGQTGRTIADLLARLDLTKIPLRKQNRY